MHGKATQYLLGESVGSGVVNGLLNYGAAYLLFHGRSVIQVQGSKGMFQDSIGETFLVISLSFLAAVQISRHRRGKGKLPVTTAGRKPATTNLYLRAFGYGLAWTLVLVACNAWLLPRVCPNGVSFHGEVWFKTLYGAILGAFATCFAVYRALNEAEHPAKGETRNALRS